MPDQMKKVDQIEEIRNWVASAQPGSSIVYARAAKHATHGPAGPGGAAVIYSFYEAGRLMLVQRRVGGGAFDYIAIKRRALKRGG